MFVKRIFLFGKKIVKTIRKTQMRLSTINILMRKLIDGNVTVTTQSMNMILTTVSFSNNNIISKRCIYACEVILAYLNTCLNKNLKQSAHMKCNFKLCLNF